MAREKKDAGKLVKFPSIYSTLVSRSVLLGKLGYGYGGDRNIFQALGYSTDLKFEDYIAQYSRQDIAKAVIDRPVQATWRGGFSLEETKEAEDTDLEKAFKELYNKIAMLPKLIRLDKLTGLGRYGILLLGLSDAKTIQDYAKPVTGVKHDLLFIKPFGENSAQITNYETEVSNERYGKPTVYQIMTQDISTLSTTTLQVHHTRIIHVADGQMESEIEGTPRLKTVFNRLKDLEKIVGGSAEMFWRGARPGYQGKIDPEYDLTTAAKENLQDEIDEFEHNLRRLLMLSGIELQTLAPQVADPRPHVDVQLQMISAVTGIPKRVLVGSERGELASEQDRDNWFDLVENRRVEFAEQIIIRPLVDRLIELRILPEAKEDYSAKWKELREPSDKEMAEVGAVRASALKEYSSMPNAEHIVPPDAFLEYFLGLDAEKIELIGAMKEEYMKSEEALAKIEEEAPEEAETTPEAEEGGFPWSQAAGYSYPGPHKGRPGKVGGSAPRDATAEGEKKKGEGASYFYHGTSSEYINSIKKNGLIPGGGKGTDAWITKILGKNAAAYNLIEAEIGEKGRQHSVFISKSLDDAMGYAALAGENAKAKPVVFKITIPKEFKDKVIRDEYPGESKSSFRFEGKIEPEWISGPIKLYGEDDKNVIFYGVTLIKSSGEENPADYSYPAPHKGRKGEQGGSAPRDAGSEPEPEYKFKSEKEVRAHVNPDPCHLPAGQPTGGQFTACPGGGKTEGLTEEEQARLKVLRIPPAWKDVRLNKDPRAALQAVGVDSKGRLQYRYSAEHSEKAAAEKFTRLRDFNEKVGDIIKGSEQQMNNGSLSREERDAAAAINLMAKTGFRPGSYSDPLAAKRAYGALTLEGNHIKIKGKTLEFNFMGKKGVAISQSIEDGPLSQYLSRKTLKPGERVFEATPDALKKTFEQVGGRGFLIKDLRTWKGTATALSEIKNMPVPKTAAEVKKAKNDVAKKVASRLGNTPAIALKSYIAPEVFSKWEFTA